MPVRIGTLRAGLVVPFDVYLHVANHYVRHTVQDDVLDQDRFAFLKSKGVRKVFIANAAEQTYLTYLDQGIDALRGTEMPRASQAEVAQSSLMSMAGEASVESEAAYQGTQVRVEKISEFLLSDKNMVHDFLKTSGVSKDTAQHSATVSTLAVALAAKVGLKDKKDLLELGLACLLHDIGKDEHAIDPSILRKDYTPEQLTAYLKHPEAGEKALESKAFVSPSIRDLVRDHEEIGMGDGYPGKKRLETLSPVQQVLNICNHYDMTCQQSGVSPIEAGRQFFIDKVGLFKLDLMTALSEVVNIK